MAVLAVVIGWQRHTLLGWFVEETLAHVLQADVSLAALEPQGGGSWKLIDLRIIAPAAEPRLRQAELPRIDLQVPWSALRRGRVPSITVHGGVLHLTPRAQPPTTDEPPPNIERLRLIDLRLSWEDGDDGQSAQLDADLSQPLSAPRGELRLRAPWLDLGSLLRAGLGADVADAGGRQDDVDLRVRWTDDGPHVHLTGGTTEWQLAETRGRFEPWSLVFEGEASHLQLALGPMSVQRGGRHWKEDAHVIDGQLTSPGADGGRRLQAETAGGWFEVARWDATWSPAGDLQAMTLELLNWRWQLPDGATAALTSRLDWRRGSWGAETLLHGLDRPSRLLVSDEQSVVLHRARLPLRAHFAGDLRSSPDLSSGDAAPTWFDGTLSLQSAEDLHITARGAWHLLEDPPRIDLELDASDVSLTSLQEMLDAPLLPTPWQGDGTVTLTGALQGPVTSPHGHVDLEILEAALASPEAGLQLDAGSVRVRVSTASPWPTVRCEHLTAQGTLLGPADLKTRFQLDGSLELDSQQNLRRLDVQNLQLDGGALGLLQGDGTWTAEDHPPRAHARWTVSGVDVAALRDRLPSLPQHELLRGATLQGSLGGDLTLAFDAAPEVDEDGDAPILTLGGPVTLEGLGYASSDGSRVVEGAGLRLESNLRLHEDGAWQGALDGDVDGFLLLWDTFFGDFESWSSQLSLQAEGTAPWPPAFASEAAASKASLPQLDAVTTTLTWPEGLHVGMALRPDAASPETWHLDANLTSDSLASLHQRYLAPSFGDTVGQHLEGRLEWQAEARLAPGVLQAEGRLTLHDTAWTGLAGTTMEGLQLDLPMGLALPDGTAVGATRTGKLHFQKATAGGFQLPATETVLWTEGAALGLVEPLELPLYGGRVALEELQIRDLLNRPRLQAALRLEALDLTAMSKELGLPALEGRLDGELARVDITQQELRVDGGGSLALFGGRVDIGEISGSEIFTPFPRIELSADLHDIDLGRLTRQVDFGEMHGTLQGSIENCSLFRGIPVTCRARFETVQRPGVRRSVDVKAVNNLTVLGTGARTNVFDRGIQRLFKRFTYDRFGVSIDLANDALLLQGLERRGEKELFMSGRLPFPIDIINAQPGRRVSFQAMLDRLESLDFEGVTTTSGTP